MALSQSYFHPSHSIAARAHTSVPPSKDKRANSDRQAHATSVAAANPNSKKFGSRAAVRSLSPEPNQCKERHKGLVEERERERDRVTFICACCLESPVLLIENDTFPRCGTNIPFAEMQCSKPTTEEKGNTESSDWKLHVVEYILRAQKVHDCVMIAFLV